jgi:biopolymer transport protein ExbD
MFNFERQIKPKKKIDMTPLIDIIFQLVIFFMLTTTFARLEVLDVSVDSKLANGGLANSGGFFKARDVVINLSGTDIFANGYQIGPKQLAAGLEQEFADDPKKPVKIYAGAGVSVQSLINVIDIVRQAGGSNLTIDSAETGLEAEPVDKVAN